jgi:hypothetical protein
VAALFRLVSESFSQHSIVPLNVERLDSTLYSSQSIFFGDELRILHIQFNSRYFTCFPSKVSQSSRVFSHAFAPRESTRDGTRLRNSTNLLMTFQLSSMISIFIRNSLTYSHHGPFGIAVNKSSQCLLQELSNGRLSSHKVRRPMPAMVPMKMEYRSDR